MAVRATVHRGRGAAPVEQLRALLGEQVAALDRHEAGAIAGEDPGELKRFRVATRRLRALLRAGRPLVDPVAAGPIRAELAWLGGAMGPARDLDVLLTELRETARHFEPGEQYGLTLMFRRLEDDRAGARALVRGAIGSDRYRELREQLRTAIPTLRAGAAGVSLHELAGGEFRKLAREGRGIGEDAPDRALHDLRLRVKRARYAAELASLEVGGEAARFVVRARAVQDILGEHQDAAVAEVSIRALLQRPQSIRWAIAAGRLIERQHGRRSAARAAFPTAWAALEAAGRSAWPIAREHDAARATSIKR